MVGSVLLLLRNSQDTAEVWTFGGDWEQVNPTEQLHIFSHHLHSFTTFTHESIDPPPAACTFTSNIKLSMSSSSFVPSLFNTPPPPPAWHCVAQRYHRGHVSFTSCATHHMHSPHEDPQHEDASMPSRTVLRSPSHAATVGDRGRPRPPRHPPGPWRRGSDCAAG